jgi:hypothetical protein
MMDLLTPTVPEREWDPNFAALVKHPNPWNAAVLNDWGAGFPGRDGKFVREFQTTFNACFWELYINAVLRERKFAVEFDPSPDFTMTAPWPFTVEATIASNAQGSAPEHRRAGAALPDDLNEFNRQAIIRLSNSLMGKYKKLKSHYERLPHVGRKPFVIAVAPFDRPNPSLAAQRAIEAVLFNYYVDEEAYITADVPNAPIPRSFLASVEKDNQAPVELGLFRNGVMPEVSAVVFSSCATWGKVRALSEDPNPDIFFTALRFNPHSSEPHKIVSRKTDYKESLLDGLRVYHNPDALYRLDPAAFRSPEIFQVYYSPEASQWIYEQHEGQLLFRTVLTREGHQH